MSTSAKTSADAPLVRLEGVRKSYGANVVLQRVDLEVRRHELVCLIGASGSGKSTLLRCVNQLERVDDGRIYLGDTELTDPAVRLDEVRRRIGIVFQSFNLFPHMTVLDNVALAPRRVHGLSAAQAHERAIDLLERLGLGAKAADFPDRLSGGQQQRVAIARALVCEPEVMLFDEVTSALDPELVGEVLDVVRDLKETGMTMILATHEMSFARQVADQVCFLERGAILERGSAEAIFESPQDPRTQRFLQRVINAGRM
ncbi:amino acid ABC transporter ATP-binding protein [Streptomyces sp. NPDC001617]